MRRIILSLCALLLLAGCKDNETGKITGTVSYLQRIALPPDAKLSIKLEDVLPPLLATKPIAEKIQPINGAQVPLAYELSYSTANITPSHRYQVRAAILAKDGSVLFTTTQMHPVVPEGGDVEVGILVQPVPPQAAQMIENMQWELVALGEILLPDEDGAENATLTLQSADKRINGSTGCNKFFGTYALKGPQLSFGGIGMTKMACMEPAATRLEQRFVEALGRVNGYRVNEKVLELLSEGTPVARFEAGAKL